MVLIINFIDIGGGILHENIFREKKLWLLNVNVQRSFSKVYLGMKFMWSLLSILNLISQKKKSTTKFFNNLQT